jgi:hypothetical protein
MNPKTKFATFNSGFLFLFVVLFLLDVHWAVLVAVAVAAIPVNVVLYRKSQNAGGAANR